MKQNGELSLPPIDEILKNKYLIVSIIGPHDGEKEEEILSRKIEEELANAKKCFWSFKSSAACPSHIQSFCRRAKAENYPVFCILISPASKSKDPFIKKPNKEYATHFSSDNVDFNTIPEGIKTGGKKDAFALIFKKLERLSEPKDKEIDLWDYSMISCKESGIKPIKIKLGASTICSIKEKTGSEIKSRKRKIVAVAKLKAPFCVWVKRNS